MYAAAEQIIEEFDFIIYEQFFFLGKHLAEKYNKPVAKSEIAKVQELIRKAPGNAGGAEMIISYYKS